VLAEFGRRARYFNTFGGNPVCVAAASAVLDVLGDEGLPANALSTGGYLAGAIAQLAGGSPVLAEVRGVGLYLGVDVVSPSTGAPSAELASAIVNGMRARRVLISATGPRGHVLKIRPPLPFGRAHADRLVTVLSEVVAALLRGPDDVTRARRRHECQANWDRQAVWPLAFGQLAANSWPTTGSAGAVDGAPSGRRIGMSQRALSRT
jgi:hypothetical protein